MADQADGSIIIDTEINSDGFKAGSAELLAAIKALSTEVKNLGQTLKELFSKPLTPETIQVAQRIRLQRLRQKYRSCKPPSKNYRIPTATERLRRKQLHRR